MRNVQHMKGSTTFSMTCVDVCSNTVLSSLKLMYLVLKWCLLHLLFSSKELKYFSISLLTVQNFLYKQFTNNNEGIANNITIPPPPPQNQRSPNGLENIFSNLLSSLLIYAEKCRGFENPLLPIGNFGLQPQSNAIHSVPYILLKLAILY